MSQEQFLSLMGRLEALERRNGELEAQLHQLQARAAPAEPAAADEDVSVSLNNGRPTFASADGQFTASLRGVLQLDASHYDQTAAGPLATDYRRGSFGDAKEADHARDLADGANFRRARLGIEGKAFGDWNYNFLFDFGGSGREEAGKISSLYLEYAGLSPLRIRAGAFPPVTGFDDATSSSGGLFPERPAPVELVRGLAGADGRTGAALLGNGDRWTLLAAVTGNIVGTDAYGEQLGAIGRATYLPLRGKDYLLHVGANLSRIIEPAPTGPDVASTRAPTPVRLRERPESRVDATRLVDTGAMDAEGVTAMGLELGLQWKALTLQGEHFWLDVQRRGANLDDPNFTGWYLQGAWTLTGERRRYSSAAGGFDMPRIERPFSLASRQWGGWELAARYSDLDLDFRTRDAVYSVFGGQQQILSLGLNWYPNNNVRFLADYQRVDIDRFSPGGAAFGAGVLTPPAGAQVGQDLNIWSLRTQYAF